MQKLHIGIVEDDLLIAESIAVILSGLGYRVTAPARTYTDAVRMIETEKPDLLLVDIMLQGNKDGIDLAATVRERYNLPFIFLTANSDKQTVERAKTVLPFAYLVKPFSEQDLYTSIEIATAHFNREQTKKKHLEEQPDFIFVKDREVFVKLRLEDIIYLKSDNVYLNVYTSHKHYVFRTKLETFIGEYGTKDFVRVHRSFGVNLKYVESVSDTMIHLNKFAIPIQRNYRDELLQRFKLLK